jgi:AsmA family
VKRPTVKRLIQVTLISVVATACLAGLGLLSINLYVQSPGAQLRIREAVSEKIGLPINVFRITFTPWGGFLFQDVTIENPAAGEPLLRARDLRVECDYLPFLEKRIAIKQVLLHHVDLRLLTAAPVSAQLSAPSEPPKDSRQPDAKAASPSPSAEPSEAAPSREPARGSFIASLFDPAAPSRYSVEVKKFKLYDGSIYLVGADGVPSTVLRDVDCELKFKKGGYVGELRIGSAKHADSIHLEDINSPVRCSGGSLELERIRAGLSGGEIRGTLRVDLTQGDLPYQLALRLHGVNINEMVGRAGGFFDRAHGTLEGTFQVTGLITDPAKTTGQGNLDVKSGYLDQYPMLQEIGKWTQIDELQKLLLDEAASEFTVVGRDIRVDSLRLVSKNCQMNLSGKIDAEQKLALGGRLMVSRFLSEKIPNELEENFVQANDGRGRYLDFHVTGTLVKPQTDLFDRIVGDKGKLLDKILRSDRHEKRREKRRDSDKQPDDPVTNG